MEHATMDINQQLREQAVDPEFPHAPEDWTRGQALATARAEGIDLGEEHWELLRALQGYYARHDEDARIPMRELHDALEERFHSRGGMRHLYELFPGGPLAQGCRLAGVKPPYLASDPSFGSVS